MRLAVVQRLESAGSIEAVLMRLWKCVEKPTREPLHRQIPRVRHSARAESYPQKTLRKRGVDVDPRIRALSVQFWHTAAGRPVWPLYFLFEVLLRTRAAQAWEANSWSRCCS